MGHTYAKKKKTLTVHLKFKFNGASYILSDTLHHPLQVKPRTQRREKEALEMWTEPRFPSPILDQRRKIQALLPFHHFVTLDWQLNL